MLEVNPRKAIYWPAMLLGLWQLLMALWSASSGLRMVDWLSLVGDAVSIAIALIWVVCSIRPARSALKCKALIASCILDLILLAVSGVIGVIGIFAEPKYLMSAVAGLVMMVLMGILDVGIAREVHYCAIAQGYMPRF